LTATSKPDDIQKIEMAGMQAFLQKPFAESDLLNTIIKILPQKTTEPGPENSTENTMINLDELLRISGGDTDFRNEMLRIFIRSSEEALTKLHENSPSANPNALAETAHKLAAPAKHLQATSLYNHLKKLETIDTNSSPEEIKKLIGVIGEEIEQINSILKQKIQE